MERHLPACGGVVFDDQGYLSRFLAQAAEEEETIAEMTFLHLRFGPAELRGLEFAHCRFEGCSFAGCRMDRLYLKESVLEQCDLSGWTAADATFASVVWQDCRLSGAQLSGSVFRDCALERCAADYLSLSGCTLRGCAFSDCRMPEAFFDGCRPTRLRLSGCLLTGSDFTGTPLKGIDLTDDEIDGLRVAGPELRGAIVNPAQACELARAAGGRDPLTAASSRGLDGYKRHFPPTVGHLPLSKSEKSCDEKSAPAPVPLLCGNGAGALFFFCSFALARRWQRRLRLCFGSL